MSVHSKQLPKAERYQIGVNIDLEHHSLCSTFSDCSKPHTQKDLQAIARDITGNNTVTLVKGDEHSHSEYRLKPNKITLANGSIRDFIGVLKDNMPPNIPKTFTEDLMDHLVALHESEHVTQYARNEEGRYQTTLDNLSTALRSTWGFDLIKEVDADLPVLEHLRDLGLPDVAQTWIDLRHVNSFITNIPLSDEQSLTHDTSTLLSYYESTGDVLEPDVFIKEKLALLSKINAEMGINNNNFKSY